MKRFFVPILVCLVVLFSVVSSAQAQPVSAISSTLLTVAQAQDDVMEQLKTNVLPKIQTILTPEQQEQLEAAIVKGTSIRKAFKSLALTPAQKIQLATVFKSLPNKEMFSAMTLEQKRELFMKKKELFKPTPEEIAGYKAKKEQ